MYHPFDNHTFQWPPLVTIWGGRLVPQMNKLQQVSSNDHQMSVRGGKVTRSDIQDMGVDYSGHMGGGVPYHMSSPM